MDTTSWEFQRPTINRRLLPCAACLLFISCLLRRLFQILKLEFQKIEPVYLLIVFILIFDGNRRSVGMLNPMRDKN